MNPIFFGQNQVTSVPLPSIPSSGQMLWISADYITISGGVGSTPADGTTISSWADRSSNANNLTRSTGTATFHTSQINGYPAVTFSSCNFNLASSIGQNAGQRTCFAVVKQTGGTRGTLISGGTAAFAYYAWYDGGWQQGVEAAGQFFTGRGAAVADTNWHQINVYSANSSSGNTLAFRRDRATDAATIGTISNMTASESTVGMNGGANPLAGQLAELIYYNRQLTGTEMTQVETYLLAKYGL